MIRTVTGTPGSGKTCYAVMEIVDALAAGKTVATNIALSDDFGRRIARRNPANLLSRRRLDAATAAVQGRLAVLNDPAELRLVWPVDRGEGRCLVVIDEAHALLDSRDFRSPERQEWITWLTQHRKLGLDLLFVVQHQEMLDTNVRRLVEWEIRLRDLRRARAYGVPVPLPFSVAHWFWATMKAPQRTQTFRPRQAHGLYDTTATLHGVSAAQPDGAIILPRPASPAASGARRASGPGTDPAPTDDTGNTEGAAATTATPSREDALPASLDVGP